jgi:hypothetical protein
VFIRTFMHFDKQLDVKFGINIKGYQYNNRLKGLTTIQCTVTTPLAPKKDGRLYLIFFIHVKIMNK